jgi:protein required for attachment to host cells
VEATDWHHLEEHRFIEHVAKALAAVVREQSVPAIVIAAPPKALADLRKAFHADVKAKIVAEIGKDLTNEPVSEIERHLLR